MIYCLTGELIHLDAMSATAVIDCMGVGYKLTVSANTLKALETLNSGEKTRLYTHMAVREDAVELFGFATTEELDIFRMLISVSGVGPKAAVSILSVMTPSSLITAISAEDARSISRAPGVGAKTAARIVLELRDKLAKSFVAAPTAKNGNNAVQRGGNMSDARDALIVLGYSRNDITSALAGLDPSLATEELIRMALAKLM